MAIRAVAIELGPMREIRDRQHLLEEIHRASYQPQKQKPADISKILRAKSKVTKSERAFRTFIESKTMGILVAVFIALLIMVFAILMVYFTAPRSQKVCEFKFKRTMTSSLVSSSEPRSAALGDLNNDHQMDFVVANSGTNTIGVFIAQGNGTFLDQKTYSTGPDSRPYSVAIHDFNNDSHADIAVANYGVNNIRIFFGRGDGTLVNQGTISLGSSRPIFVTTGDFNNDHRIDLAVVNNGTNTIDILYGYGNGSFHEQTTYSTGYDSLPSSLAIGDFNHDTYLDIAVVNTGTNTIGIFLNYGNETFTNQQIYSTGFNSTPSSIAVGDINNDRELDIVVSNYGTRNIGIFYGYGNGTFSSQITYVISSDARPQYISVNDVNNDNLLDIIIVDTENDQIHFLPGHTNESFSIISTYDAVPGSMPYWIAVTDFNNNNQSDIVVVNHNSNNVVVFLDYFLKPSARKTNPYTIESVIRSPLTVNDFNNDRIPDIVFRRENYIVVLLGLGNGTFIEKRTYSINVVLSAQYICSGDLNNDERMDIVIANIVANSVHVFLGHGNGTFASIRTYFTGDGSRPYWVTIGDVNNDQILDIVSADPGLNAVGILIGNANGTFAPIVTYPNGDAVRPYSVAVGDINNDHRSDIVAAYENGRLVIFLQQTDSTFIIMSTYLNNMDTPSVSVALADFNRDNYLDIVVTNTFIDSIGVLLGFGNGTFESPTTYPTGVGSQPYYVIVTDYNNDNIPDIVASNFGSSEIVIFYGYGNGSFALARTYPTGYGSKPIAIAAADFNNDKQLEIVTALWGTKDIVILTQYYAAEFISNTVYTTDSAPQPSSLTIGHFNSNNRSDIIVANSGTGNLSIHLNFNNSAFEMETMYSIGYDSHPQYVINCDINKDNQSDIVSVNTKMDSISIIMGKGNGSFAKQIIYYTGSGTNPYAVVSGDLNNDDRLDLVVANEGTDSIGIFYGFNYTSFQYQQIYLSIESLGPGGITAGDFNNDHILDIAAVFQYNDSLCIFLGIGNGNFTMMETYSTEIGSSPYGIAVGDFNNDNKSDIVVTNPGTKTIGVFLGYGNGSFARMVTHSIGNDSYPMHVAIGDFNKDSQLDIVVTSDASDNIAVLFGLGNGSFTNMTMYSTEKDSLSRASAVADFDKDGRLDIAVVNTRTDKVGILFGYGNGTFGDQKNFSLGFRVYPYWIITGDFNNDDQVDIATVNYFGNDAGILLGYGNGNFTSDRHYSTGLGSQPSCLSLGDFNHDNISDIAVTNYGTSSIVILFGFGDGSFLAGKPYPTDSESKPWGLITGDFNNDNQLDTAVITDTPNIIGLYLGHDSEPFGAVTILSIDDKSHPHSLAVGHINNDTWLDIIVANYGNDSISILLSEGNGNFINIKINSTETGSAPHSLAVAHLNNDTYFDIVVSNSGTDHIGIFLNDGNGTFTTHMQYSTGTRSRPYTVLTADFNNDTLQDIAVANSGTNNILLLYGYGNGTFGNQISYPLGYGYQPYSIAARDLDGDGWIDIAIACYGTDHIEALIKKCEY